MEQPRDDKGKFAPKPTAQTEQRIAQIETDYRAYCELRDSIGESNKKGLYRYYSTLYGHYQM